MLALLQAFSSDAFAVLPTTSPRTITHIYSERRTAPNKRESLRWVIQSLQRYPQPLDPNLWTALQHLEKARTQRQVADAGRLLDLATIPDSIDIQERLIKAASIAGLLTTAQRYMDALVERKHVPSPVCYVAFLQGLRQGGRYPKMQAVLDQLRQVAVDEPLSVLALNTYLAALLEDPLPRVRVDDALTALRESSSRWNITPDAASFATVMNSANRSTVDQLWTTMTTLGIEPSLYCYHARLKVATDDEALDMLQEIQQTQQPNRYTIDLMVLPLARSGKIPELLSMLTHFVRTEPEAVSKAFAAFLTTLCRAGDVESAQMIFEKFLGKSASTRHYNILISGYRKMLDDESDTSARGKAIVLYKKMIKAGLRPDEYTLTSMTGFAANNVELSELMRVGIVECNVEMTPVVLRAAITAYGTVQDPSSACWIFDMFPDSDVKTWNVLMGALAKGGTTVIRAGSSEAALVLGHDLVVIGVGNITGSENRTFSVVKYVDKLPSPSAARVMLDLMAGKIAVGRTRAPRPNSQTYALAAKALQYGPCDASVAMGLFQNATRSGVTMDGRFLNGVFRLFGDDIDGALLAWRNTIRRVCITDNRALETTLVAAYHGILFVCGRALRPDVALRIVYVMYKENVIPDETALNCYLAGKRRRLELPPKGFGESIKMNREEIRFAAQFESLLSVECLKFNTKDKRRQGEKRVRIIL